MTITGNQISKTIGQILVLAALVAYWAPAVSYMSSKILATQTLTQTVVAEASSSQNTTVVFEVMDTPVTASQLE